MENYIREFLAITHYSDLPDIILIEFFCDGINQPLQSKQSKGPSAFITLSVFGLCFVVCWLVIHCGFRGVRTRHCDKAKKFS